MENTISRREFIRTVAVGAGGALCAGLGANMLQGCRKVPLTDRMQLAIPALAMNALGATSYVETLASSKLSTKRPTEKSWVKNSGSNISGAVESYLREAGRSSLINGFSWQFELIEDDVVNAWCMPGGRIAFYEGIMPLCKDETGVAVVMGHEIAHAVANHSGERMLLQLSIQLGGMALSTALEKEPEKTRQIALYVFGVGSQLGATLPYSRKHEYEADKMGLIFMAMAGYDPRQAPEFWERMPKGSTPQFLSTHPSHGNRIQRLNEAMPEAMQYYSGR